MLNNNDVVIENSVTKMVTAPVFLVGAERSGSTMLRLMLNDHPDVCWLNEFEYAVDRFLDYGQGQDIKKFIEWLSVHRTFTATHFEIDEELDYRQLVNSFLIQKRQQENKTFVGATVHRHFDRLLMIWPDAKFIHILRDPRDVASSVLNIGWVGHISYGCERWIEAEKTWERIISNFSGDRFVELRFEELLKNPEKELLAAWRLIGVDPKKYTMKYWECSTYSPPNPKLSYQWKTKLKSYEIQLIENRLGPKLTLKGYEPSNLPNIKLNVITRLTLSMRNRWGRAMNRRKRYGMSMWIASIIAPRVPVKTWRRAIRLKLNEIERRQLK